MTRFVNRSLADAVAYQAAWFVSVWGAVHGLPLLGPAAVSVLLVSHLALRNDRVLQVARLLAAAVIGFALDGALIAKGAVVFPGGVHWPPLFMVALWPAFFTLVDTALGWLKGRFAFAALLGAVGGPLAYLAGARSGAFREGHMFLPLVALEWGLAVPLLLAVKRLGSDALHPELQRLPRSSHPDSSSARRKSR